MKLVIENIMNIVKKEPFLMRAAGFKEVRMPIKGRDSQTGGRQLCHSVLLVPGCGSNIKSNIGNGSESHFIP